MLFDGEAIWFRRVEYDVEATFRKINAIPMLANHFGDGLREGRVCVGSKRPNQAAADVTMNVKSRLPDDGTVTR